MFTISRRDLIIEILILASGFDQEIFSISSYISNNLQLHKNCVHYARACMLMFEPGRGGRMGEIEKQAKLYIFPVISSWCVSMQSITNVFIIDRIDKIHLGYIYIYILYKRYYNPNNALT